MGRKRGFGLVLAAAMLGVGALAGADSGTGLQVEEPWVREVPEVSTMTAGYLRLVNRSERPRQLVAARAERFPRVELHESLDVDGVARMEQREHIDIPAQSVVELAPGGLHLMLMQRQGPAPSEGDRLQLTLIFADGEEQTLEVPVLRRGPMNSGGHGMEAGHGGSSGH